MNSWKEEAINPEMVKEGGVSQHGDKREMLDDYLLCLSHSEKSIRHSKMHLLAVPFSLWSSQKRSPFPVENCHLGCRNN